MIRFSFLIVCLVSSVSAQVPSTTEWRGLSPLKSTRMDVERTLGPPDQKIENEQMTYYYPDLVVFFYFTSNPKCQQKLPHTSWDVTSDTVTGIDVSLRHPPSVEKTGIDLTKLKKVKGDFDLVDRYHYLNSDNSFSIEVGNGHVVGYHYGPGNKQSHLRCPATGEAR